MKNKENITSIVLYKLRSINRAIDEKVRKNVSFSIIGKLLWLIGLYSVLQPLFEMPSLYTVIRYMTFSTWNVKVESFTIQGSVLLLATNKGDDSLFAWSETQAFADIAITNNINDKLVIDSIMINSSIKDTIIESTFSYVKGNLEEKHNRYILNGKDDVRLQIIPMQIKENKLLLEAIIRGKLNVKICSDRNTIEKSISKYKIIASDGRLLKEIIN